MIEPQKVVFLHSDTHIIACENGQCWRHENELHKSHGACFTHWRCMSDAEIYRAMDWLAIELAEFTSIPVRVIRDVMLDKVQGYREYQNESGRLAIHGKKTDRG